MTVVVGISLPSIALVHGVIGALAGLFLVWWTNAATFTGVPAPLQGCPFLVNDKPLLSFPANVAIIFETTVLLVFTLTFAAKDLLVTLNPHWYSTIFGIYYFSGAIVGALSVLVIAIVLLRRAGLVPRETGEEHFLDLGRLLFAFVFFWGYIAFSQYMLLWYANVPEMTAWLRIRGATTVPEDVNAWSIIALVLLVGHFLVPFCMLMTRHSKRRPLLLAIVAAWLVVMHYVDLAWVVLPELGPSLALGGIEVGLMLTVGCIYVLAAWRVAAGHRLVPPRDPRLSESVLHEPLY